MNCRHLFRMGSGDGTAADSAQDDDPDVGSKSAMAAAPNSEGKAATVVPEVVIYRVKEQGDTRPAIDYEKKVADKTVTGGWRPALIVNGTELCERVAGFSIAQNLITYLTNNLHLHMAISATIVTTYVGASYMTFIIGGFVADSWLGRFRTLCCAIVVEFLGLVLLTLSATLPQLRPPPCPNDVNGDLDPTCEAANGWTLAVLFIGLWLVALGIGSIKVCVSAFGADQFDISDPNEKTRLPYFFNSFFFFVSLGGLVAVTVLIYIQDSVGRGWGFGILAVVMVVALLLFVSGRKSYRYRRPTGSPVTHSLHVTVAAFRNRKLAHPYYQMIDDYSTQSNNWLFRFLDKATIIPRESAGDLGKKPAEVSKWHLACVEKVEEVKRIFHLIPTMASSFLYYTVLAQTLTFSVEQSATLERNITKDFTLPAASVAVFLHLSILITIPLFDFVLKPALRRITGHEEGISILQRIGIGLFLSIFAMITAALVERRRLSVVHKYGYEDVDNSNDPVPMSVWWLIPQYVLVGCGEVFAYCGHMEFFYNEAPKTMRTIGTGFFLFTLAMGYFASSIIVLIVEQVSDWLNMNLNQAHLDNFYWLMAGIAAVNFFIYVALSRHYTYTYEIYQQDEQRQQELRNSGRRFTFRSNSRVAPTTRELFNRSSSMAASMSRTLDGYGIYSYRSNSRASAAAGMEYNSRSNSRAGVAGIDIYNYSRSNSRVSPTGMDIYTSRSNSRVSPTGMDIYPSRSNSRVSPTGMDIYPSRSNSRVSPTGIMDLHTYRSNSRVVPVDMDNYRSNSRVVAPAEMEFQNSPRSNGNSRVTPIGVMDAHTYRGNSRVAPVDMELHNSPHGR